ncbi:MAG: hypothetical protein EBZ69_09580 [Alphaproteobacteria bacterium]|nr:hypothetical protein [Alphaproteobacteria bacterium]
MNPLHEPSTKTLHNVISLGAGVQSSCMALMCAKGEIKPIPDFAIFADTQDEPQSVYDWLAVLKNLLPFPVHTVTAGKLSEQALKMRVTKDGRRFSKTNIPFFTKSANGKKGRVVFRSCTSDFKIKPIIRELRKICHIRRGQNEITVTQYVGISWDEWHRCKPSRDKWIQNRWPLIEKRMNRQMCLDWMTKNKYPTPPRSSCVYCPFHSDMEWRRLKEQEPNAFAKAVKFEADISKAKSRGEAVDSTPYLHRSCVPLKEVDFRDDFDNGQMDIFGLGNQHCEEGMCGV